MNLDEAEKLSADMRTAHLIKTLNDRIQELEAMLEAVGAGGDSTDEVTVLHDGSAFAVYSYPLPKDHWLYSSREYEQGAEEPKELAAPILTHAAREQVVSAIRYAVRAATDCGKETNFDPDALVQNAVYALCGPFNKNQPQPQADALDAGRYRFLRSRDLETVNNGGVFAGVTPDNIVLNGADLDAEIDAAIGAAKQTQGV